MATDYSKELEEWASSDYYDDHVYKIQLPYAQVVYYLVIRAQYQK